MPPERSANRPLTPEETLDYIRTAKETLLNDWERHKRAVGVINGELLTTENSKDYEDPEDHTKWKHTVGRVPGASHRLVIRSHYSSARARGTLVEDMLELDENPNRPTVGFRRSIIGAPSMEFPQERSDDSLRTLNRADQMLSIIGKHKEALVE